MIGIATIPSLLYALLCVGLHLIDRLGRRTLLIVDSFGYSVSLSLVVFAFFSAHFSFAPVCIFPYIASHAVGQGATIWVYIAEIFPNRYRAEGQALGSFTHWLAGCIDLGSHEDGWENCCLQARREAYFRR
jgi:MFS family permease